MSFGLPDSLLKRQLRVAYRHNLTLFTVGAMMASVGLGLGRQGLECEALVPMMAGGLVGHGFSCTIAGAISSLLNTFDFGLLQDRAPVE